VTPTVNATFVFADLAGFTALTEAHGDEQAAAVVADFGTAVRDQLPATGGHQVKGIGDAVMLCIPDPGAAVRLGLRITHELMLGHGAPAVRVGMHHGPAIERDGDYFGAAVNLAARVSAEATGGEVLLTGRRRPSRPACRGCCTSHAGAASCATSPSRLSCSPPSASARRRKRHSPAIRSAKWPSIQIMPSAGSCTRTARTSSARSRAPRYSRRTQNATPADRYGIPGSCRAFPGVRKTRPHN